MAALPDLCAEYKEFVHPRLADLKSGKRLVKHMSVFGEVEREAQVVGVGR